MRPTGLESLRAIQSALAEHLVPELTSIFAQDVAQTTQMLLESLAAEWDTAADDLARDNRSLTGVLDQARGVAEGDLAREIATALAEPEPQTLRISDLYARNARLRGTLEQLLVAIEDESDSARTEKLARVRRAAYGHLRDVALRGWSFWDVASFRERVARARAAAPDDPQRPLG